MRYFFYLYEKPSDFDTKPSDSFLKPSTLSEGFKPSHLTMRLFYLNPFSAGWASSLLSLFDAGFTEKLSFDYNLASKHGINMNPDLHWRILYFILHKV